MTDARVFLMSIGELRRSYQSLLDENRHLEGRVRATSERIEELERCVAEADELGEQRMNVERSRQRIESIVAARAASMTADHARLNAELREQIAELQGELRQRDDSIDVMRAAHDAKARALRRGLAAATERATELRAELFAERKRTRLEQRRRIEGEARRTLDESETWEPRAPDLCDVALVAGAQLVLRTEIVRDALDSRPRDGDEFLVALRRHLERRIRSGQDLNSCRENAGESWAKPRPDWGGPIGP